MSDADYVVDPHDLDRDGWDDRWEYRRAKEEEAKNQQEEALRFANKRNVSIAVPQAGKDNTLSNAFLGIGVGSFIAFAVLLGLALTTTWIGIWPVLGTFLAALASTFISKKLYNTIPAKPVTMIMSDKSLKHSAGHQPVLSKNQELSKTRPQAKYSHVKAYNKQMEAENRELSAQHRI